MSRPLYALPTLIPRKRDGAAPCPVPSPAAAGLYRNSEYPKNPLIAGTDRIQEFQNSVVMPEYDGFFTMRTRLPCSISHPIRSRIESCNAYRQSTRNGSSASESRDRWKQPVAPGSAASRRQQADVGHANHRQPVPSFGAQRTSRARLADGVRRLARAEISGEQSIRNDWRALCGNPSSSKPKVPSPVHAPGAHPQSRSPSRCHSAGCAVCRESKMTYPRSSLPCPARDRVRWDVRSIRESATPAGNIQNNVKLSFGHCSA